MVRVFLCYLFFSLSLLSRAQSTVSKDIQYYASFGIESYQNGAYEPALAYYDSSFVLGNKSCIDWYNASCCAALLADTLHAYSYLFQAIEHGYCDAYWLEHDSDMDTLRQYKNRWSEVAQRIRNKIKVLEKTLGELKSYTSSRIIPFCKTDRWGYYDKVSGKILVSPYFLFLSFVGETAYAIGPDYTKIFFSKNGTVQKIVSPQEPILTDETTSTASSDILEYEVLSNNNGAFKGFHLDERKKIVRYSDLYYESRNHEVNISKPFKIGTNYVAIVRKNNKFGIIDSLGNPLPAFDFCYDDLFYMPSSSKKSKWFYYYDKEKDTRGFINDKGVLWNEENLLQIISPNRTSAAYTLQFSEDKNGHYKFGILDLQEIRWLLKPMPFEELQNRFGKSIEVNQTAPLGLSFKGKWSENIKRENVTGIYLLIANGSDMFYVDLSLKKYWPSVAP